MDKAIFNLIYRSNEVVKSFNTLRDCVNHIRLVLNDSRKYDVEEVKDGRIIDTCSAYYLLENHKDLDKLPSSLGDC